MASRRLLFKKRLTSNDAQLTNLTIPLGEGRGYFQRFGQEKAIPFWDGWEKQWNFCYKYYDLKSKKNHALSGEWQKFVEAKNLQAADIVSIETERGHELRFYVHISRGVPAGIQLAGTIPFWAKVLLLPFKGGAGLMELLWRIVKGAIAVVKAIFKALVFEGDAAAARLPRSKRQLVFESSDSGELHFKDEEMSRENTTADP